MLEAHEDWKKREDCKRLVLDRLKECGISPPVPSGDPDFWFFIALELAFKFVPDFNDLKKKGRPKKWNEDRDSLLLQAVKKLRPTMTERSACHYLAKYGDFRGTNGNTLYRRLHRVRKPRYSELARILAGIKTQRPDTAD